MADVKPVTHLEKYYAGLVDPVTHLEKVIAQTGGGGGSVTIDDYPSEGSPNAVASGGVFSKLEEKADKTELADYVTESELGEYATSDDVEDAITDAIAGITRFEYYLCNSSEYDAQGVPTVQNPDTNHIYLTPTSGTNLNMYAYINSAFTFLGTTEMDLSGYATTAEMTDALLDKADANHNHDDRYYTEDEIDTALALKADASDVADCITESELNTALADKADANHNHDSRYYTESEVDTKLGGKSNTGHTHAYSEITGTPTIPTVPSNLVTGKDNSGTATAYTIKVQTSWTGTAPSNQITIVVPS